jgi:hypothetical protein
MQHTQPRESRATTARELRPAGGWPLSHSYQAEPPDISFMANSPMGQRQRFLSLVLEISPSHSKISVLHSRPVVLPHSGAPCHPLHRAGVRSPKHYTVPCACRKALPRAGNSVRFKSSANVVEHKPQQKSTSDQQERLVEHELLKNVTHHCNRWPSECRQIYPL